MIVTQLIMNGRESGECAFVYFACVCVYVQIVQVTNINATKM